MNMNYVILSSILASQVCWKLVYFLVVGAAGSSLDAQIYLSIHQEPRNEDALPRYTAPPDLGNGIMSGLLPGFIFPENGLFVVFCLFCQKERKSICLFYKHFVQSELNWKYQS